MMNALWLQCEALLRLDIEFWPTLVIVLTLFQFGSLIRQYVLIEEGDGVDVNWHGYFGGMLAAFAVYGAKETELAMVINGCFLATGHIAVTSRLLMSAKLSKYQGCLLACAGSQPIIMWKLDDQLWSVDHGLIQSDEIFLLAISVFGVGALIKQALTTHGRGEQSIWPILGYLVLACAWLCFGLFAHNISLQVLNSVYLVILMGWLVKWCGRSNKMC